MAKRKKIQVIVEAVQAEEKTLWQKIKDWFYHSESVFLAWVTSVFGIATAFIGSLNFAPLWTMFQTGTEFTSKQLTWMGIGILGAGITMYIARVRGTKEVENRLLPKAD